VTKDVGGYVTDYENQTALYRASQREVRLHECRSACTLALSLPNGCVFPDSILKFHFAYDPRDHQIERERFATNVRFLSRRRAGKAWDLDPGLQGVEGKRAYQPWDQ
jgi:hypothetical protein